MHARGSKALILKVTAISFTPFNVTSFLLAEATRSWCLQADFRTSFARNFPLLLIGCGNWVMVSSSRFSDQFCTEMLLASYWLAGLRRWCLQADFRPVFAQNSYHLPGGTFKATAVRIDAFAPLHAFQTRISENITDGDKIQGQAGSFTGESHLPHIIPLDRGERPSKTTEGLDCQTGSHLTQMHCPGQFSPRYFLSFNRTKGVMAIKGPSFVPQRAASSSLLDTQG